jgi:hypothetical protein
MWPVTSVCLVGKFFCIRIVVTQREVILQQCVLFTEYDKSHKHSHLCWSDTVNINEQICYNLLLALCYIFCNILLRVLLYCINDAFFVMLRQSTGINFLVC